jgi:cytosine/adenosine deaminase-related metal-dependent hydrolase
MMWRQPEPQMLERNRGEYERSLDIKNRATPGIVTMPGLCDPHIHAVSA